MKLLRLLPILLCVFGAVEVSKPAVAAIGSTAIFDVRTTGSNANAGLFDPAIGTTDYSQGSPIASSTSGSATNGSGTFTDTAAEFTASDVGNGVNIAGVIYEISAYASSTSVTITPVYAGTTASGLTTNIGGSLLTPAFALSSVVSGNYIYVQSGTYSSSTQLSASVTLLTISGYQTTHGDMTPAMRSVWPTLVLTGASTGVVNLNNSSGSRFEYFVVNANSETASTGISINTGGDITIAYCLIEGFKSYGISEGQGNIVRDCEITSPGNTVSTAGVQLGNLVSILTCCYIHDFAGIGITSGTQPFIDHCIVANCTGTNKYGISCSSVEGGCIQNCDIFNCGGDGIHFTGYGPIIIQNNILASNGGYGINFTTSEVATPLISNNAFYLNTSGTTTGITGTQNGNEILSQVPCVNFTVSGGLVTNSNYQLNKLPFGGGLCRGHGVAGAPVNITGVSAFNDMGSYPSSAGIVIPR